MTVYSVGNEFDMLDSYAAAEVSISTSSRILVSGVNRAGLRIKTPSTVPPAQKPRIFLGDRYTGSEGWIHFSLGFEKTGTNGASTYARSGEVFGVRTTEGASIFKVFSYRYGGSVHKLHFADGPYAVTDTLTEPDPLPEGVGLLTSAILSAIPFDIHYNIHSTEGFIRIYIEGSLVYEYEGDTQKGSADAFVGDIYFGTATKEVSGTDDNLGGCTTWLSQFIHSDLTTLGARLHTLEVNPVGADMGDWTGDLADVAGQTSTGQVYSDTPDGTMLFSLGTMPAINEGANEVVSALIVNARALIEIGAPVDRFVAVTEIDSTVYESDDEVTLTAAYQSTAVGFAQNPVTLDYWTPDEINAARFGLRTKGIV